ncbi:MarR family transcriptional regulator [bacterium]|nr:MarR family transcriptional regulator [bacterium]MBU1650773.1 MarR family transcriptional regulator [bacterium]MBU1880732.1 MarR family transcriptional regulator [bacterium]
MDEEKFTESLGTQINLVARSMRTALERELAIHGVTPSQWMLLMALGQKDHQGQTGLGRMVNLDNATITRCLDKLQDMELIVRRQDKDDRRAQKVSLTPKGHRAYSEWNAIGKKINDNAAGKLSQHERKILLDSLGVIIQNLNQVYPD